MSWDMPGCQELISIFNRLKLVISALMREYAKAAIRHEPSIWPGVEGELTASLGCSLDANTDFASLTERMGIFIYKVFNRKTDLDDNMPRVLLGQSAHLTKSLYFDSLVDYLLVHPDLKGPDVMTTDEKGKFYCFLGILDNKSNTRAYRSISHALRTAGFSQSHVGKICNDAAHWYGCRVVCSTIEDYVHAVYNISQDNPGVVLNPTRISEDIAPFDKAMGYPRKWRS